MTEFFTLFINFFQSMISTVNSHSFDIFGVSVGIFDLIFGFIALSMVISIFWKGAKG